MVLGKFVLVDVFECHARLTFLNSFRFGRAAFLQVFQCNADGVVGLMNQTLNFWALHVGLPNDTCALGGSLIWTDLGVVPQKILRLVQSVLQHESMTLCYYSTIVS